MGIYSVTTGGMATLQCRWDWLPSTLRPIGSKVRYKQNITAQPGPVVFYQSKYPRSFSPIGYVSMYVYMHVCMYGWIFGFSCM